MKHFLFLLNFLLVFLNLDAQNFSELLKAVASDRASFDNFGYSVSISGGCAVIGAYNEDENAVGTNTISNAGSVYIFERNNKGYWNQVQKIVASDRSANSFFGYSVSISGSYLIVGAYGNYFDESGSNPLTSAGSAYIFERNGSGIWIETQKLVASDRGANDEFGYSVGLSGNYAIVGAHFEDEDSVGNNTSTDAGSAYIFERNSSGHWTLMNKITAADRGSIDYFGSSVSISGNYSIVGAFGEDEDATLSNTKSDAGSAYIFKRNLSGLWTQTQKLVASDRDADDYFGISVSIYEDYAIIGAAGEDEDASGNNTKSNAGSAYIFKNNGSWSQLNKIVASDRNTDDRFGQSVNISSKFAIVGAYLEDDDANGANKLTSAGSAYLFQKASNWSQIQKIVASDRGADDRFGSTVSCSGNYCITGAFLEDHDKSGGNTFSSSGSAYISGFGFVKTASATICNGDTYYFGTQVLKNAGTYKEIFQSVNGLDSIVTLTLYVNPKFNKTANARICFGSTYKFGTQTLNKTGIYSEMFKSIKDCDSFVTLTLTVNPLYNETVSRGLCQGSIFNFGTQKLTNAGVYKETFKSYYGCDSTVTLTLSMNPTFHTSKALAICYGDVYKFGKQKISKAGNYTEVFKSVKGCDSTVDLSVSVTFVDTSVTHNGNTLTANLSGAAYQWLDCNNGNIPVSGATSKSYTPVKNGSYSVIITQNTCFDTSSCFLINGVGINEEIDFQHLKIYPNPVDRQLNIDALYAGEIKISVFNLFGQKILEQQSNSLENIEIDCTFMKQGIYFLQLLFQDQIYITKFERL